MESKNITYNQYSLSDIEKMANIVVASNLFGIKNKTEAVGLMLIAQAEGRHPALAARDYHIIQGRPALKADAMLARFQEAGGRIEWTRLDDDCVVGNFIHPQGSATLSWDMARAQKAGLLGRAGNMWQKYPRQMLRSRVISEGIRTVYPSCVCGIYEVEEVKDFNNGDIKDITADTKDISNESVANSIFIPDNQEKNSSDIDVSENKDYSDFFNKIELSESLEQLKVVFQEAYTEIIKDKDRISLKKLIEIKNARKDQLTASLGSNVSRETKEE